MSNNLHEASHQWATRPEDQRFESYEAMLAATTAFRNKSIESKPVPYRSLRAEASNGDIVIVGDTKVPATLGNYAFGQLARSVGAPAEYLRELPATLAAQNLNFGLKQKGENKDAYDARILFHGTPGTDLMARAINSEIYDRTWNNDVLSSMRPMFSTGWRVPPARPAFANQKGTRKATAADIIPNQGDFGLSISVGDFIAPAGLYASDHDMFAFLVNPERSVKAGNRYLMRGVFVRNSEVGDGALVIKMFLLDSVCGNHICWGVSNVHEIRVKHVTGENRRGLGDTLKRALTKFKVELRSYESASASETEKQIAQAMAKEIAGNRKDVLDAVFKYARSHSLGSLTYNRLETAYDLAETHSDWYGSPRTVWGMVSGLTEASQQSGWQDQRSEVDQHAAKLMEMSF